MSEAKTIKVLESLGGSAELSEIRKRAKQMYPDMQLYRTIHTPLKSLLEKDKVKCRGTLKRGGRKNAPKTFWTLTDVSSVVPPIKTAKEMLDQTMVKYKDATLTPKEKDFEKDTMERYEKAQKLLDELAKAETQKTSDGTPLKVERFDEIPMHEDVPVVNTEILTLKKPSTGDELYTLTEKDKEAQAQAQRPHQNGTLVNELKQAIKEPYLDKLEEVVETVEKKDSHYRGRHDIIFDILGFMETQKEAFGYHAPGIHVTEIMYKTMLSHWQLKRYIVTCLKNELIAKTDVGYKLTEKGLSYLHTFKSIPINFD